jgi:hypothetical protein
MKFTNGCEFIIDTYQYSHMAEEQEDNTTLISREEWLQQAVKRYDKRQESIRDAHFNRWGSGNKVERNCDIIIAKLDQLLATEEFQRIKYRYLDRKDLKEFNALDINDRSSDYRALTNLMAADYCAGSLEFLLCETHDEYPEKYLNDING